MVRSKVALKCIEDVQKRRVSFSKRRAGLMKKAKELSVLCNADIGVIVFSGTRKLYEFASSSMPQIIRRYNESKGPLPSASQAAQPDLSRLLAQQADEIRSLKEEVTMLETENTSLLNELEQHMNRSQPICDQNANLETALTLRPPNSDADLRLEAPTKESGSTKRMR